MNFISISGCCHCDITYWIVMSCLTLWSLQSNCFGPYFTNRKSSCVEEYMKLAIETHETFSKMFVKVKHHMSLHTIRHLFETTGVTPC